MKKLLQINPVLRISTSTGRIMQEIGELATQNGWESYVAYGRDGEGQCNSHIIRIGNKLSIYWHAVMTRLFDRHGLGSTYVTRQFINQIQHLKPDIIHIHNIHGYILNYKVLFEYLYSCDIPVIWTIHDCWLYTGHCYYYSFVKCNKWQIQCTHCPQKKEFPTSWWLDRSEQNFLDKKKAFTAISHSNLTIVPVSDWIKGEMQKSFLKEYNYRVIHNGIDTRIFNVCESSECRSRYNLKDKFVILGVASIWSEEKGLFDFIKLAELLHPEEVIILVGVKPGQMKLLPCNIIGISRTENIHQLAELYSLADVFVNPTWQDNYPTVNMEAIACGTPVVTYRTGGSIESVTGDTGFIVEQGDIRGVLEAVRHVEERGKEYYKMRCREYALTHFRKEDRYAYYLELYDELLNRR